MKSDRELVAALKAGNEKAFKNIMENWYVRLYNFANGYLNNTENAREVIQDVFLQLWENRKNLADDTSLNAYLFTVTRNHCIDLIRREKLLLQFRQDKKEEYARLMENFQALSDPVLDEIFTKEFQAEIDRAVESLPAQCRKVFVLSRKEGLKNKEICNALNLSPKTVESYMPKALKTIQKALEAKFPGLTKILILY